MAALTWRFAILALMALCCTLSVAAEDANPFVEGSPCMASINTAKCSELGDEVYSPDVQGCDCVSFGKPSPCFDVWYIQGRKEHAPCTISPSPYPFTPIPSSLWFASTQAQQRAGR